MMRLLSFLLLIAMSSCSPKKQAVDKNIVKKYTMDAGIDIQYTTAIGMKNDRQYDFLLQKASNSGFLKNLNTTNTNVECALGRIFFWALAREIQETDGMEQELFVNDNTFAENIKPWCKIDEYQYGDSECTLFFLPCVHPQEYILLPKEGKYVQNLTRMGKGNSPYTYTVKKCDKTAKFEHAQIVKIEIDHLLRNNKYILEIPEHLHKSKNTVLDPFIPWHSSVGYVAENRDVDIAKRKKCRRNDTQKYWKERIKCTSIESVEMDLFRNDFRNNYSNDRCLCNNEKFNKDPHNHNEKFIKKGFTLCSSNLG